MLIAGVVMISNALILFFISGSYVNSFELTIPRGVALSKASLYNPNLAEFTCLDGSVTLPFTYVNDDYCDCHDGSDEPGTPACPNGVFHCSNSGYIALNIPSSRVNDGICDCCDASDEYITANCTDVCAILGAEAKIQAEKLAELIVQGNQLRIQLSTSGKQLIQEKQARITLLNVEKAEAERLKVEAEALKTEAETKESAALAVYKEIEDAERKAKADREIQESIKEAADAFRQLDSNQDERIQVEEVSSRQTFDQNKDGQVSDEELKFFMEDRKELTWREFHEITWPRLKPFYMMEKGLFTPPEDNVNVQDEDEGEEQTEDGTDADAEEDWDRPGELDEGEKEDNTEDSQDPVEELPPADQKYDEKTQNLIDEANKARSQFEAAERAVQDLERELSVLKDAVGKDYGSEHEFAPLDGQCFTFSDREYTYKLCPFDQVIQSPKSGGSETRLGQWKGWESPDEHTVMLYDRGQSCWNGPQRSTRVFVSCGLENSVVGASEPNKCEYVLEFKTPAACKLQKFRENHDEL